MHRPVLSAALPARGKAASPHERPVAHGSSAAGLVGPVAGAAPVLAMISAA
jgi:hypothetical protein